MDTLAAAVKGALRMILIVVLRLLGMGSLLGASGPPSADLDGDAEDAEVEDSGAESAQPAKAASKESSPAPTAAKSRLRSLLAEQPSSTAATESEPSEVDSNLRTAGLSDKFAQAMSKRMSGSGKAKADLSSPWARTLLKQLSQLRGKDRDPLVRVQPPADLSEWVVEITGAPGSIYEGEKYKIQFNFDRSYPKKPPRVRFLRPVPKHEHIYSDGKICLNILYNDWKEEMTVLGVSQSLISMMASAAEKKRPPDNAATIMNSIHQDPTKMQWLFHDDHC